jgi:ABC-type branched-subunit amino acid transport system ATPase component
VVGLSAHANARIGTLPGGQRRRLDVAIGIVGRPELLFLDEPAAGLLVAPPILRRMAQRESGSRVAARRERAMLRAT